MPAQDRARATKRWQGSAPGQPCDKRGEDRPVRQSMRGRGLVRRRTVTSWRSTRSSTSLADDVRTASRSSPSFAKRSSTAAAATRGDHVRPTIIAGRRPRADFWHPAGLGPARSRSGYPATVETDRFTRHEAGPRRGRTGQRRTPGVGVVRTLAVRLSPHRSPDQLSFRPGHRPLPPERACDHRIIRLGERRPVRGQERCARAGKGRRTLRSTRRLRCRGDRGAGRSASGLARTPGVQPGRCRAGTRPASSPHRRGPSARLFSRSGRGLPFRSRVAHRQTAGSC